MEQQTLHDITPHYGVRGLAEIALAAEVTVESINITNIIGIGVASIVVATAFMDGVRQFFRN